MKEIVFIFLTMWVAVWSFFSGYKVGSKRGEENIVRQMEWNNNNPSTFEWLRR